MVVNASARLQPKQVRLAAIFVGLILLALIWAGFWVTTRTINNNFESTTLSSVKAETAYLDDHLDRAFQQVDNTLLTAKTLLTVLAIDGSPITNQTLAPLVGGDRLIRSLSVLDTEGQVIASSNPKNANSRIPIKQLIATASPRNTTNAGVIYGPVEPYRDLSEWANKTPSPTQRFLPACLPVILNNVPHVLLLTLNTTLFSNFWERIGHNQHTEIAVFDYNGTKFLSHHKQSLDTAAVFDIVQSKSQNNRLGDFFLTNKHDFLVSYRASDRYPKITASIAYLPPIREQVESEQQLLLGLAIFGSLLVLTVLLLTYRLYLRYERAAVYSRTLLDGITAHVMMSRSDTQGNITDVNEPFLSVMGYERHEVLGQNHEIFDSGQQPASVQNDLWGTIHDGKIWRGTFRNRTKSGQLVWLNSTIIPLKNEWGHITQYVTMYSDISNAIKMSEEIERERTARQSLETLNRKLRTDATRDPLTGCWNRRGLDDFLEALSTDPSLTQSSVSVLMLDLDHFKAINDTDGHHAGDLVLKACANAWQDTVRSSDLLVRLGGEEFAMLLFRNSTDDAWEVAEKLRLATEQIRIKIPEKAQPINVTVSIGVAHATHTSKENIDALMRQADVALYDAKRTGRNRVKLARS
ncbi:MAG: diguanylate cyclase [Orrella sp.]